MNNYLYFLEGKPYINLTNNCTNSCVFCVRDIKDDVVGSNLWLQGITKAENVIAQFDAEADKKLVQASEITFCGYGEPLLCPDVLIEVSKFIKEKYPHLKIRINTNGTASKALKRDILPELVGLVDVISISLNAHDSATYDIVSKPKIENSYDAVLASIKQSAELGFKTIATIVTGFDNAPYIDIQKCEEITNSLGAEFRNRAWIKEGY